MNRYGLLWMIWNCIGDLAGIEPATTSIARAHHRSKMSPAYTAWLHSCLQLCPMMISWEKLMVARRTLRTLQDDVVTLLVTNTCQANYSNTWIVFRADEWEVNRAQQHSQQNQQQNQSVDGVVWPHRLYRPTALGRALCVVPLSKRLAQGRPQAFAMDT